MEFLETFYTRFVPVFLFTVMVAMGLALTVDNLLEVLRKAESAADRTGRTVVASADDRDRIHLVA